MSCITISSALLRALTSDASKMEDRGSPPYLSEKLVRQLIYCVAPAKSMAVVYPELRNCVVDASPFLERTCFYYSGERPL